jgi:phosphate transport system substrate-binding protein
MMARTRWLTMCAGAAILPLVVFGCGEPPRDTIETDGSSTVAPTMAAIAEEFWRKNRDVRLPMGVSGTGGGVKKFIAGEIDIVTASRPLKQEELDQLRARNIAFIELPIAFDGLSVVVNPGNDFIDHLTVEELRRIWAPNTGVRTWADVRPGWPRERIRLYGPGTDSGTFDYFTEAIVGKSGSSRRDYQASEDDHTLVQGVSGDLYALGYFGYAYYEENQERLRLVPIDGGDGPVTPTRETIGDGTYRPLSRPLFVYVRRDSIERPDVEALLRFIYEEGREVIEYTGYVPLPDEAIALVLGLIQNRTTGSVFHRAQPGMPIRDVLQMDRADGSAGKSKT